MPVDPAILADNAAQPRRVEAIASRLGDTELQRDLGWGWTVAVSLAHHVAFWDRLYPQYLRRWQEEGPPKYAPSASLNDGLLDEWFAVTPRPNDRTRVGCGKGDGHRH